MTIQGDGAASTRPPSKQIARRDECAVACRSLGEHLLDLRAELAELIAQAYIDEVPAYQDGFGAAPADLVAATERNVAFFVRVAISGTQVLDESTLAALNRWGSRQARSGFPLHAVLRAYQIGLRVGWRFVLRELRPVVPDPALAAMVIDVCSGALLDTSSAITNAVAEGFFETDRRLAAAAERARRGCFDDLCAGRVGTRVQACAEVSGIRLANFHAVVVVVPESMPGRPAVLNVRTTDELERRFGLVRLGSTGSPPAVDPARREVRFLWSAPASVPSIELPQKIRGALVGMEVDGALSIGVGRVEAGIEGIAVSHEQARRSLRTATPQIGVCQVVTYDDSLLEQALLADEALRTDAERLGLGALNAETRDEQARLLATVEAYLECHRNVATAARRLGVHRHTVVTRLRRAEALSAQRLDDPRGALLVQMALIGHQLSAARRLSTVEGWVEERTATP